VTHANSAVCYVERKRKFSKLPRNEAHVLYTGDECRGSRRKKSEEKILSISCTYVHARRRTLYREKAKVSKHCYEAVRSSFPLTPLGREEEETDRDKETRRGSERGLKRRVERGERSAREGDETKGGGGGNRGTLPAV